MKTLLARPDGAGVRLLTRRGIDWTTLIQPSPPPRHNIGSEGVDRALNFLFIEREPQEN
jgi:hypothetical protein